MSKILTFQIDRCGSLSFSQPCSINSMARPLGLFIILDANGEGGGIRTLDKRIKSPLLYH